MDTMTKTSIWQQAGNQRLSRKADRARRKNRLLKVRLQRELSWYLSHGWKIASHTAASYGQGQYWLLTPA